MTTTLETAVETLDIAAISSETQAASRDTPPKKLCSDSQPLCVDARSPGTATAKLETAPFSGFFDKTELSIAAVSLVLNLKTFNVQIV